MAFWLKAAEGLLEEVDRRAKQAVSERLDHSDEPETTASEKDLFGRKSVQSAKGKGAGKPSISRPSAKLDQVAKDGIQKIGKESHDKSQKHEITDFHDNSAKQKNAQLQAKIIGTNGSRDSACKNPALHNPEDLAKESEQVPLHQKVPNSGNESGYQTNMESKEGKSPSHSSDMENIISDAQVASSDSKFVNTKEDKIVKCNFMAENDTVSVKLFAAREPSMEALSSDNQDRSEKEMEIGKVTDVTRNLFTDTAVDHSSSKMVVNEESTSPVKRVEEQLNEAQGLLKTAASTGKTKEARLARVCAGLSSRLQEYKAENAQLEELLSAEREEKKMFHAQISYLEEEVHSARSMARSVETEMANALKSKNTEIETLTTALETARKQAIVAEEKLASLQASTEAIIKNRELTETRMMQALREELELSERRADEERLAHNATRMAAMERESQLKQNAAESSAALARAQRALDEKIEKISDLENKVSLLERECVTLTQELQEMESRSRREQRKPMEEANLTSQLRGWQEEAERARVAQREAENKLSSMKAENQKLRVEISVMKKDAEQYSREAQIELEKRYRDLTELLYMKQTQLEAMASEKAAAVFQLEKEGKRLRELQVEAERNRMSRRLSSPWDEEDGELKPLDSLPLQHRQMVGSGIRKAAKFLDSGTVSAARFLWRHPVARLSFTFYLVFVHLFLLYLLHRLQEQADNLLSSKEAATMGLIKPGLP